jgi:hypothetical protein
MDYVNPHLAAIYDALRPPGEDERYADPGWPAA